jgi:hypothetical protein
MEMMRKHKYAEAEKLLREAYAETRLFHRKDQEHQNVMLDLGTVFACEGKTNETETMFRNAFLWASKNTGEISDENVRVWERYRDALHRLGRQSEATIAQSKYEESLFKLNTAVNAGQIGTYGPITHINGIKGIMDKGGRTPQPRPAPAGRLYQHEQSRPHFVPRPINYNPFGFDYDDNW